MKPCVCPLGVESLFPPLPCSSCTHALLAFKAKCSGGFSSQCQTLRLGEPDVGLRTLTPVGEPDIFSSLWVAHLAGMGFDYIMKVSPLPSHCGFFFVFGCKIFFFDRFQPFLLMAVQQLVVILVFL